MTVLNVDTTERKRVTLAAEMAEASIKTAEIVGSVEYKIHVLLVAEVNMKEASTREGMPALSPEETPMLQAYRTLRGLTWVEAGTAIKARDKHIRTAISRELVATYNYIQENRDETESGQ